MKILLSKTELESKPYEAIINIAKRDSGLSNVELWELILILLESVFYFPPLYKKVVLLAIIFSFIIILFWLVISYVIIKQNRNKKYSWNYLAKIIGKVIL